MVKTQYISMLFSAALLLNACSVTERPKISKEELEEEVQAQSLEMISNSLFYQEKLDSIAYPIKIAALEFCQGEETLALGLGAFNQYSFGKDYIEISKSNFDLDEKLTVQWVVQGSPTEQLGIIKGDEIISINHKNIAAGKKALMDYREYLTEAYQEGTNVHLELRRNDENLSYDIAADAMCSYPVNMVLSRTMNAYTNGVEIYVYSGLIETLKPEFLSSAIAHEIAHITNKHAEKGTIKTLGAVLLGAALAPVLGIEVLDGIVVSGITARIAGSSALEEEADYTGLYIMAHTGFELEGLENVWQEVSSKEKRGIQSHFYDTHPSYPFRYLFMKKTIDEIKEKRQKGLPIIPNMKNR